MAVYGIGSNYKSDPPTDMTMTFIDNNCACIGYSYEEAVSSYEMFKRAKIGDFIYIKSHSPVKNEEIAIKAIGVIVGSDLETKYTKDNKKIGIGKTVKWIKNYTKDKKKVKLTSSDIKNNVYNNTIYEEYSINVINKIIELVF